MGWAGRLEDRQERYCLKPGSWSWHRQRCQSRLGQWIWVPCKLQRREAKQFCPAHYEPTMNAWHESPEGAAGAHLIMCPHELITDHKHATLEGDVDGSV